MFQTKADITTISPQWVFEDFDISIKSQDTSLCDEIFEVTEFLSKKSRICPDLNDFSWGNILIKLNCESSPKNYVAFPYEELGSNIFISHSMTDTIKVNQNILNPIIQPDSRVKRFFSFTFDVGTFPELLLVEEIKKMGFEIDNSNETVSFLSKNPEIKKPLLEAQKEIEKYFENAILKLSSYKDHEEGYEVLNLIILSNLPTDKLLEKENLLFDNWFEKHYLNLSGKITMRVYPL